MKRETVYNRQSIANGAYLHPLQNLTLSYYVDLYVHLWSIRAEGCAVVLLCRYKESLFVVKHLKKSNHTLILSPRSKTKTSARLTRKLFSKPVLLANLALNEVGSDRNSHIRHAKTHRGLTLSLSKSGLFTSSKSQ